MATPPQAGVVHITPRPRRQSIGVEHYSGILGSSVNESLIKPPPGGDCYQTIPMTTTNLSEDGKYIIPESSQTVLEERQNVLLKRRSSWRRFKDKVSGWVTGSGGAEEEQSIQTTAQMPPVPPPRRYPSLHIDIPGSRGESPLVVEDAEALLKSTNCYSSGKRLTPQPVVAQSPEIPKIIVTCDKFKSQEEEEEEIRKRLAVAKIKEAITSMNSSEDVSNPVPNRDSSPKKSPNSQRRHSSAYDDRRKSSADIHSAGRRGSGPNLRRTHSAKLTKAKPMIWEHFEGVPGNSTVGKCKECHMAVSCKYNTGQFVRHLQNSHKEVYRAYQSKMDSAWAKSVIERNLK